MFKKIIILLHLHWNTVESVLQNAFGFPVPLIANYVVEFTNIYLRLHRTTSLIYTRFLVLATLLSALFLTSHMFATADVNSCKCVFRKVIFTSMSRIDKSH